MRSKPVKIERTYGRAETSAIIDPARKRVSPAGNSLLLRMWPHKHSSAARSADRATADSALAKASDASRGNKVAGTSRGSQTTQASSISINSNSSIRGCQRRQSRMRRLATAVVSQIIAARTARNGGSSGGSGEPLLESRLRSGADPSEAEKRRRSAELGVTYSMRLYYAILAYIINIPHITTGRSPANIMYNRDVRTRFSCLKPCVYDQVENQQRRQILARPGNQKIEINVGDKVYMDAHGVRTEKRVPGEIVRQTAPSTFIVKSNSGATHKRHVDQLVTPPPRRSPRLMIKNEGKFHQGKFAEPGRYICHQGKAANGQDSHRGELNLGDCHRGAKDGLVRISRWAVFSDGLECHLGNFSHSDGLVSHRAEPLPETQGSLEKSHHSLIEYLKIYINDSHWYTWIHYAVFSYNTSIHTAHGLTPYELIFAHEARIPSEFTNTTISKTYNDILDDIARKLNITQRESHGKIIEAKKKSKAYYDLKSNAKSCSVCEVEILRNSESEVPPLHSRATADYTDLVTRTVSIKLSTSYKHIIHVTGINCHTAFYPPTEYHPKPCAGYTNTHYFLRFDTTLHKLARYLTNSGSYARAASDGAPKHDNVNAVSVTRGRPIAIKKSSRITVGPKEGEEVNLRDAPAVKAALVRTVNPATAALRPRCDGGD
ncbi:unnamed protein product [Trichogramma brassicae]|uniref:Integrase catalytic domain-containing protein n=1 Tax=Trichogramma brassicae TaxID=86971 RepID=A0A6H5IW40_9HYME|nr:unnamed protein product [Trichogramma brassicae]